jgi:hypothetical protein
MVTGGSAGSVGSVGILERGEKPPQKVIEK